MKDTTVLDRLKHIIVHRQGEVQRLIIGQRLYDQMLKEVEGILLLDTEPETIWGFPFTIDKINPLNLDIEY